MLIWNTALPPSRFLSEYSPAKLCAGAEAAVNVRKIARSRKYWGFMLRSLSEDTWRCESNAVPDVSEKYADVSLCACAGERIQIVSVADGVMLLRTHGFPADRRWGKCAQSNCCAAFAVSFSSLRRELSRSHQHRLRDARDEGCWPNGFGHWHGVRDFLYWLLRPANSGRAAGGTLECKAPPGDNADHMGRIHNAHRFCAHSAAALRRSFLVRRSRGRIFSRRNRLSFALVYLS